MGAKPQPFLRDNEFLSDNDYLQSTNRLFFAMMEGNGHFTVYRGSDPGNNHGLLWYSGQDTSQAPHFAMMEGNGHFTVYKGTDPGNNYGLLWYSGQDTSQAPHFAIMQDDGNFCVYRGTDPGNNQGTVWCTGPTDPVVDVSPISKIDYDVSNAKILSYNPAELYRQQVTNNTSLPQTSTISGSSSVSEMSGWSDSLGVKVGVKTSFKTGIPVVAEGKVEISLEVSNTYTWSGSTTTTKTWSFSTPVTVPPNMTTVAIVSATITTIAVPYTLTGTLVYQSGNKVSGQIKGIYTGSNSHDLTVTFLQLTPYSGETTLSSQALNATAAVLSPTS